MELEKDFVIRQAEKKDLDYFILQAREEGWNPGLRDGEVFYEADPQGFFVGELAGQAIGCISAVRYNHFGFLGFYIVEKNYRGYGYGMSLWNHAMDYLSGCHIGLDGVVLQQHNYKKSGFQFHHPHLRFEGENFPPPLSDQKIISSQALNFNDLLAYDSLHFPSQRESFLKSWLNMDNAQTLVYFAQSKIKGLGTIRKCYHGYKIGPLFAESPEIAEKLFLHLIPFAQLTPVYIDISPNNQDAFDLVQKYKMNFVFEAARMYNQLIPQLPRSEIYGNTTFELG